MSMEFKQAKYADRILTHYLTHALRQSGATVNSDTYAELSHIIENAIKEAVQVAVDEAIRQARASLPDELK